MSSELWQIREHIIPASHPRGLFRGVRDEETSRLRLHVKQYIPKCNPSPKLGDITIILAHGVGSSKESYEPLFNELLLSCPTLRIRTIFAPDIAHHGASYLLNSVPSPGAIGDSPHWDDSARDLLQLVNYFHAEMPLPIFAIGQSWGCYTILRAALMHPRLFTGLVAIEPVVGTGWRGRMWNALGVAEGRGHRDHRAVMMAKRKDRWASRAEARESLLRSDYYRRFDLRVFEQVVKYDLVDVEGKDGGVELTTPKAMELATMMMEIPYGKAEEMVDDERVIPGFYRPETSLIKARLRDIASPVLYIWGMQSDIAHMEGYREFMLSETGKSKFGSGGVEKGRVEEAWVEGATHPIPLEKPKEAAEAIAPWIVKEAERWRRDESEEMGRRGGTLWVNSIDPEWMEKISKL